MRRVMRTQNSQAGRRVHKVAPVELALLKTNSLPLREQTLSDSDRGQRDDRLL